jgi:hypothetical protein
VQACSQPRHGFETLEILKAPKGAPYLSKHDELQVLVDEKRPASGAFAESSNGTRTVDPLLTLRRVECGLRQPLGDGRLRRGVDQAVEQGAVARDRDTVEPPLDEEVVQPFGVAFDDDVGVVDRACARDAVDE